MNVAMIEFDRVIPKELFKIAKSYGFQRRQPRKHTTSKYRFVNGAGEITIDALKAGADNPKDYVAIVLRDKYLGLIRQQIHLFNNERLDRGDYLYHFNQALHKMFRALNVIKEVPMRVIVTVGDNETTQGLEIWDWHKQDGGEKAGYHKTDIFFGIGAAYYWDVELHDELKKEVADGAR